MLPTSPRHNMFSLPDLKDNDYYKIKKQKYYHNYP